MSDADGGAPHSGPGLGLLVFATGGCLMCFEIVGGMTIAPYFGSNVFVWGSVIGVFMAALSAGYALGGRLADRRPREWLLPGLALAAGALVALVPVTAPPVCRVLLRVDAGRALNLLRPLVALVVLYFLPGMFLGMILPIAVRTASTALASVGRVVGRLYALNTLGSVAGALVSTFVLVVFFGNRAVLLGCGAALALVAAVCFALIRGRAGTGVPGADADAADEATPVAGLRPLVFVCGMALMSLEVIGGAEIAPFFGSSVFVWGSVMTVFLGALAVGYRLGGRLADRRPTVMALSTVVVAAGITMMAVPLFAPMVCKMFLGMSIGGWLDVLRPLFASLVLYFVPILLFAMVAPFAVRLSTQRLGAVGGVAGKLYALSTLGNMAGVLLTTFVLISAIGKTHLLEAGGVLVVVAAVAAVFAHNRAREDARQPVLVSALLVIAVVALALIHKPSLVPLVDADERVVGAVVDRDGRRWSLIELGWWEYSDGGPMFRRAHSLRRIRAERESPYHHIAVLEQAAIHEDVLGKEVLKGDHVKLEDGTWVEVTPATSPENIRGTRRDLKFDQYVESSVILDAAAKKIRTPYVSGTTYSDLLHLPFLFHKEIRDVVVIGGGGGIVPMMYRKHYGARHISIDVVEIDPVIVDVAQEWFGLTLDKRLRMHVQDGRMFIHNLAETDRYDLIVLDAYTAGGRIPFHLTTREFLAEVRDHLRPDGVALMNVISAVRGRLSKLFRAEYKTFCDVFGPEHVYVFPKRTEAESQESQNVILIATGPSYRQRLKHRDVMDRAAAALRAKDIQIDTIPRYAGNMLSKGRLDLLPLHDVPILTDDYAPVDIMAVELEE